MNSKVEQFGKLLSSGMDSIAKACSLYVEAIEQDISLKAVFFETYPEIPPTAWRRFEAVGRGALHPKLLTNLSYAARRLEKCSFSEQQKYVDNPLDVFTINGDVLKVSLFSLSCSQARQVFAQEHIRSLAEQRAYIESQRTNDAIAREVAKAKVNKVTPYRVVRNRLVVTGECSFAKEDLLRIILEMETK